MSEYKTLEEQIQELWASRGMTVTEETVEPLGKHRARWIITAEWKERK